MKKMNIILAILFSGVFLFIAPTVHASIFDGSKEAACQGAALDGSSSCASLGSGTKDPNATVKLALNIFSAIVGLIAVVMIMVGGLRYILSGGDPGKTAAAQNTVLYAAIGLVVAAFAQVIAQLVLRKVSK